MFSNIFSWNIDSRGELCVSSHKVDGILYITFEYEKQLLCTLELYLETFL